MNLYAVDDAENVFAYILISRSTLQIVKSDSVNLLVVDAWVISTNDIPSVLPYTLNSPGHVATLPTDLIVKPISKIGTGISTTSHSPVYPLTI